MVCNISQKLPASSFKTGYEFLTMFIKHPAVMSHFVEVAKVYRGHGVDYLHEKPQQLTV
jgi:hypothetical protein